MASPGRPLRGLAALDRLFRSPALRAGDRRKSFRDASNPADPTRLSRLPINASATAKGTANGALSIPGRSPVASHVE